MVNLNQRVNDNKKLKLSTVELTPLEVILQKTKSNLICLILFK